MIMHEYLKRIIDSRRHFVRSLLRKADDIRRQAEQQVAKEHENGFVQRLDGEEISCIAEIKKCSPSKGLLRADFDAAAIAEIYAELDVAAISVLTETDFFKGAGDYLPLVKRVSGLPVLRKDFILHEIQIYESKLLNADAVLLIARILTEKELKAFIEISKTLKIEPLVEIHDVEELKMAVNNGATTIGVNNRDLEYFHTDINVALEIAPDIPDFVLSVCESGLGSASDINLVKEAGFDAVLIGEYFMRSPDIRSSFKALFAHG